MVCTPFCNRCSSWQKVGFRSFHTTHHVCILYSTAFTTKCHCHSMFSVGFLLLFNICNNKKKSWNTLTERPHIWNCALHTAQHYNIICNMCVTYISLFVTCWIFYPKWATKMLWMLLVFEAIKEVRCVMCIRIIVNDSSRPSFHIYIFFCCTLLWFQNVWSFVGTKFLSAVETHPAWKWSQSKRSHSRYEHVAPNDAPETISSSLFYPVIIV